MEIRVKDVTVVKTGESSKGAWELIKVTSEDGTGYTTFDKGAKKLNPGAVFEADVTLKEGKAQFKEVGKVISNTEAPLAPADNMSKSNWADKDKVTRQSIEMQVRAKITAELRIAGVFTDADPEVVMLRTWLQTGELVTVGKPEPLPGGELVAVKETATAVKPTAKTSADTDGLFGEVMKRMKFKTEATAQKWLTDVCKVDPARITSEPEAVRDEVKQLQGWTDE